MPGKTNSSQGELSSNPLIAEFQNAFYFIIFNLLTLNFITYPLQFWDRDSGSFYFTMYVHSLMDVLPSAPHLPTTSVSQEDIPSHFMLFIWQISPKSLVLLLPFSILHPVL